MLKGSERMKLRCNGLRFTVKEEAKIVVCSGDFVCRQKLPRPRNSKNR